MESISSFIRIAAERIRTPEGDTTPIHEAVEKFAPHAFSLLDGELMDLGPYEKLEDDRFNVLFPRLLQLVQFLAFNALAIRTGAKAQASCVGGLFADLVRQLTEERTDAGGTTYSTFLQASQIKILGLKKFKFRPNASYFYALGQFISALARFDVAAFSSRFAPGLLKPSA